MLGFGQTGAAIILFPLSWSVVRLCGPMVNRSCYGRAIGHILEQCVTGGSGSESGCRASCNHNSSNCGNESFALEKGEYF